MTEGKQGDCGYARNDEIRHEGGRILKKKSRLLVLIIAALMAFGQAPAYGAVSEERPELTVSQALSKAVSNNTYIKSMQESEATLKQAVRTAKDTMVNSYARAYYDDAYKGMVEAQLALSLLDPNEKALKETLEYNLMSCFAQTIALEKTLVLTDKGLEISRKNLDYASLQLQLGLLSQFDYDTMTYNYQKSLNSREEIVDGINTYYRVLNKLMGQKLENKYTLVLELEYKPLADNFNITAAVNNAINSSSDIKKLEKDIDLIEYDIKHLVYDKIDLDNKKKMLENSKAEKERELEATKTQIEMDLLNNYDEVRDLERQYDSYTKELAQLKLDLDILLKQLELGQVIQLQVDSQQLKVELKEESIRSAIYNHSIKKMTLTNPNLAMQ